MPKPAPRGLVNRSRSTSPAPEIEAVARTLATLSGRNVVVDPRQGTITHSDRAPGSTGCGVEPVLTRHFAFKASPWNRPDWRQAENCRADAKRRPTP